MKSHLISINDISKEKVLHLLDRAKHFSEHTHGNALDGKIIASLFFEPSTRTRLSFESAVKYQGGQIIGFASGTTSSASKGECIEDTIRTVMSYCDGIIIRHAEEGSAKKAADVSTVPIVNAGDGSNEHPTQTLLDLYTIRESQGRLEDLHIGLAGDLKYGRTVHSLIKALAPFGVNFILIAPKAISLPEKYKKIIEDSASSFKEVNNFEPVIKDLDILYMTRTQKERFENEKDYEAVKDDLLLKLDHIKDTKKNFKILHPLPRVNELDHEIDNHPAAHYFDQVQNGLYMRQAILEDLLAKPA